MTGRGGAGAVWFVVITVVSLLGWTLVGPSFYVTFGTTYPFGGRNIGIPLAVPELANFIETFLVYNMLARPVPEAPVPSGAAIGYFLTAAGGILNMISVADAHFRSRVGAQADGRKSPAIAALLAWLVPGAGHYYLGRRGKAALGAGALLITFAIGVFLTHGTSPQRDRDLYFWSGEVLLGLPAALANVLNFGRRIRQDLPLAEMGLLFTTVSGLLNVLFILDAYSSAERDAIAPAAEPAAAANPTTPTAVA